MSDDDLPEPSPRRRPRLTPANEERLAPVDAKSRESYEISEAAIATADAAIASKVAAGNLLDELLAKLPTPEDEDGAVPAAPLELSDSMVHSLGVALRPVKKPG